MWSHNGNLFGLVDTHKAFVKSLIGPMHESSTRHSAMISRTCYCRVSLCTGSATRGDS